MPQPLDTNSALKPFEPIIARYCTLLLHDPWRQREMTALLRGIAQRLIKRSADRRIAEMDFNGICSAWYHAVWMKFKTASPIPTARANERLWLDIESVCQRCQAILPIVASQSPQYEAVMRKMAPWFVLAQTATALRDQGQLLLTKKAERRLVRDPQHPGRRSKAWLKYYQSALRGFGCHASEVETIFQLSDLKPIRKSSPLAARRLPSAN